MITKQKSFYSGPKDSFFSCVLEADLSDINIHCMDCKIKMIVEFTATLGSHLQNRALLGRRGPKTWNLNTVGLMKLEILNP